MDDEIVDVIDENGTILRQASKSDAHKNGWLHKTVIGYLRDNEDWVLVEQASHKQDAGQLVAPVAGHVTAGESNEEALLREAEEEIGTRNVTYKYIGQVPFRRTVADRDENHMFVVFEIATKDALKVNEEGVSLTRFTKDKLKAALADTPERFGDGYYVVLEYFYPDYLPVTYTKRWK